MWCSWASRSRKSWYTSSTTSLMRASGRSTLLTTRMTGRWLSSAFRSTKRVWGSGPSLASTRSSTPSTIARPRSTSPPKSAWPGVSTMLIFTSPHCTATFLARMVIPFSRSRSPESRTRSATSWFSRKAPDCQSMASTRVVLPWSTWATMATLRRSVRTDMGRSRVGRAPPYAASPMELRFLYVGSDDTEADLAAWLRVPGSTMRWRFQHFGADVAAVDLGTPPLVLVADHRPAGSVLPIYAVDDLAAATGELVHGGWRVELGPMGTPEGNATALIDPSGTAIALLEVTRPDAMDAAYADEADARAVR